MYEVQRSLWGPLKSQNTPVTASFLCPNEIGHTVFMFNSKEYPRPPYLSLAPGHGLPPFPYPQHPLAHPQPQQQPLAVQPPLSPLVTKATGKRFNDGKYVHNPSGSSFFNKFNFLPFTKFNPFPFQVTPFVHMSMTPVETKRCPTFTEGTDK